MPSNKVAAFLLLGLLVLPLLPTAEASHGADLVVVLLEAQGVLVQGKATDMRLVVRNQGDATFSGAFEVFIKHNGACFQPGGIQPACQQQFQGQSITAGSTYEFPRFSWTPTGSQLGVVRLDTEIRPPNGLFGAADAPNTDNNDDAGFSFFVGKPGVRVVPDRDLERDAEGNVLSDATLNKPWRLENMRENACKPSPEISRVGCMAKPGSVVVFRYRIENAGNLQDSFTASVLDTSSPSLAQRGWKFHFSPQPVALPPFANGTVNVVVEVPPEELADRGVNVGVLETRFRWTSGLDSAVTSADPPCDENLQDQDLCHDPSAPSVAADAFSRFRLEANRTRQVVSPDRATQFNLTVYNTGNAVDDFAVRLDPASAMSASWVAGFEGALLAEMPANTHRNASVSVRPPDDAVAGAHTFDLVVQSNKSTSGKTDRVQFTAVLEQRYNVTAAAPITFQRVVPAQPAVYQIPLRNNGNGWDNVTVSLENVTGGWSRALSAERVALPPFGTAVVTATVAAPPNTRSDTQMEFFALFQSSGPAERPGRVPLHAYVQQGSNVDAEFTPREQFVDLGKTVSYTLRVRNVGNIADKFAVTPEREQGGTSWRVAVEPAELVLHPLQEAFVTLNVTGPGAGDVGQTTRVLVHLRAESDGARYTRNVTARVSGPDLFVESILLDKESPYSGDEVQVSVVLGNRGNRPPSTNTSLRLEFVKDGVPALIGGQERGFSSVDLGGGVRITERFAWNTTGIEGPLVLRAAIDAPNAIAEIDDSPASNEATKPLVIRTYDIRITPPQALPAHPGERVSYGADPHVFVVEYRGNQPTEPVRIRLESEHGWGLVARDLELPQFTPIPIPIDLAVPESPGAARDALRLTVTPTLRPEAAVVSSITTLIVDEAPPTVVSVRATPEVAEVNEEVALEVVATDPTGVSEVVAFLALPGAEGNGTRSFPLARADGDRWVLRQGFDAPGVYRYYVTVRDNAEPANENSTASVVRSFRVSPGTQPLVKLADGQGTTVRTGPPIRLNVTDPLGIGAANYTIKGVRFDMERPFQIDTTGFQAGTVEVLVTAENIYGAAATSRFTFTVDNTQPAIRKVTLKPESPDTNQETTLRVETDADAAAVSVVLRNNGQVVDTRNATKRAVGVWELTFQPGEGDNVLDVTATDAAGNSRVMEGAVRFDAGSRGLIPWGGPAIAVLAAACAALLLGTRRRG